MKDGGYLLCYTANGSQWQGVGIRKGSTLSVGWTTKIDGDTIRGVTVYAISVDGATLEGAWTTVPTLNGAETLKRVPE